MVKVLLKRRKTKAGKLNLYLSYVPFYITPEGRKIKTENLQMYLYGRPSDEIQKQYNKQTMQIAEMVRCNRFLQIQRGRYGIMESDRYDNDFIRYFKAQASQKGDMFNGVIGHFIRYSKGKCAFDDLTLSYCQGFIAYLQHGLDKPITHNTVCEYARKFSMMLKYAYDDRCLEQNFSSKLILPKWQSVDKPFLTFNEIRKLYHTPCEKDVVRRASLFSIFTGLRKSDIVQLDWSNIEQDTSGRYLLRITMEKTGVHLTEPLPEFVMKLVGPRKNGKVFPDFPSNTINTHFKRWVSDAGINKHLTFHCTRHTFAMLLAESDTDIHVIKEMMGHQSINNTLIYAKMSARRLKSAADKLNDLGEELERCTD